MRQTGRSNRASSFIRTLPLALEFHQIMLIELVGFTTSRRNYRRPEATTL